MLVVSEQACRELIGIDDAEKAVESVFAAMARGEASNFPVIRETLGHAGAVYGFKSGFDRAGEVLGVKAGGYWPDNEKRGLTNHQSSVFLFDPDNGRISAMVGGNHLTALRTAAASAVSIKYLAREDSRVLGIVGAGFQSAFQLRAAAGQRAFRKIVGWNPHPEMLARVADTAQEIGLPFDAVDLDELGRQADVIVTITSSFAPLLMRAHVRPGTHIACMGTDTKGKQEVEAELVASSTIFTDEIEQAVTIGECQHPVGRELVSREAITLLGSVINGDHVGRTQPDEITLFDGTGIALQDLAVASVATKRARERNQATLIDF